MIRRLALILPLALLPVPALAEQPDPAQTFGLDYEAVDAAVRSADSANRHAIQSGNALVNAYRARDAEAKKAQTDLVDANSRLQWVLENWVPKESPPAK